MAADNFDGAFSTLKIVFDPYLKNLSVQTDTPIEFTLLTKAASPFPQHKGQQMYFGSVRVGKAYVSFHLMPLYMNPPLAKSISPALKKRMQGKTCFNFKTDPDPALIADLQSMTGAAFKNWSEKKWI